MKLFTKKGLERLTGFYYSDGFRDAVESLVKAIESGDKVVLGNSMSFIGMTNSAPMTLVGNHAHIANSVFTMDSKRKHNEDVLSNVKICGKL